MSHDTGDGGTIAESFEEIVLDERTQAYQFAALGPDGEVVSDSASKSPDAVADGVKLCASIMLQWSQVHEDGEEKFVRDVINEMNERRDTLIGEVIDQ